MISCGRTTKAFEDARVCGVLSLMVQSRETWSCVVLFEAETVAQDTPSVCSICGVHALYADAGR
jgi:hypothetical protein